jgi:hypothetical protein
MGGGGVKKFLCYFYLKFVPICFVPYPSTARHSREDRLATNGKIIRSDEHPYLPMVLKPS